MVEIKVNIPETFKEIIDQINEPLYIEALKAVVKNKLPEKKEKLKEIQQKIELFNSKYSSNYNDFSKHVPDSFEGHEDWIEWSYLNELSKRLESNIMKLNMLFNI